MTLEAKKVMITGATRGLGRAMAIAAANSGAKVCAIGRTSDALKHLEGGHEGIRGLRLDVSQKDAAKIAFQEMQPDVLILNAGARPKMGSIQSQDWGSFSVNWELDVKHAFHFGQAALLSPLAKESRVVTISSGAAIGGSFVSGGYAGAKRMQWFMSDYMQRESDDNGLGLIFQTILPKQQFRETTIGDAASRGYAERLGITQEAFCSALATHYRLTVLRVML
jgi:NAD(P)-dependent dehydrogenase (short-subunit alcohol dehydrogenase family)